MPADVDRNTQKESGFSLIEVMVAVVVLTVGLVGLLQLLAVATIAHSDARQATAGTLLAQSKLDQLMKAGFSVSSVALGGLDSNVASYFDQPEPGITRRWSVSTGPVAGTYLVTVRVVNNGARVYGRQQQLTTIVRNW